VATPILTSKTATSFHAQSQDTGRGIYTRLWRANRDVDIRRKFLGFCLSRVYLLALLLDGPYGGEKTSLHLRFTYRKTKAPWEGTLNPSQVCGYVPAHVRCVVVAGLCRSL